MRATRAPIAQGGSNVSGGQQRLFIARLLLKILKVYLV